MNVLLRGGIQVSRFEKASVQGVLSMGGHLLAIISFVVILGSFGVFCIYHAFEQRDQVLRFLAYVSSLMIFLAAIMSVSREIKKYNYVKQFTAPEVMSEYLAVYPSAGVRNPCLPGQAVVIDRRTKSLSGLMFELPVGLRARSPKEVKAIVLISCEKEAVGTSSHSEQPASRRSCDVEVVDRTIHAVVAQSRFVVPDQQETSGVQNVFEYILGLPRGTCAE